MSDELRTEKRKEGWTFCLNWRRAHYIRACRSLCGRWMYLGSLLDADEGPSPDDCATCRRLKDKEVVSA
jgi:hypothetical protein